MIIDKKTDMLGQGDPIPEVVEDLEEQKPSTEESDTETDTGAKPDTETDTGDTDGSLDSLMTELNLAAQYGSPEEALRAVAHQRQRIENQRQENFELRRILQQTAERDKPVPSISESDVLEGLQDRPTETMRRAGFVDESALKPTVDRVNRLEQNMLVQSNANAIGRYDELKDIAVEVLRTGRYPRNTANSVWEAMMAETDRRPSLLNLSPDDFVDVAYNMVKGKANTSPPVPPSNRRTVSTTSGGRKPPKDDKVPDFNKMDWRDIRKWYADRGMID